MKKLEFVFTHKTRTMNQKREMVIWDTIKTL